MREELRCENNAVKCVLLLCCKLNPEIWLNIMNYLCALRLEANGENAWMSCPH